MISHESVSARARPRRLRISGSEEGFTLLEMMLVVAIALTLSAIAIPRYEEALNKAKVIKAISEIRVFGTEIQRYEIANSHYPETLDEAGIIALKDPWGNPYHYLKILGGKPGKGSVRKDHKLNPINADFDLYSMGRDGQTHTQITNGASLDDVIRASDGSFIGLARDF